LSPSETHHSTSTSVEILIALEGAATIIEKSKKITFKKGKAVLIVANTSYKITTTKGVEIYRARVPKGH
jgi:mannose-6-phosphate isomerase